MDQETKTLLLRMAAAILVAAMFGMILLLAAKNLAPPSDADVMDPIKPPPETQVQDKAPAPPAPDEHLMIDGMVPDEKMLEKAIHDIQLDVQDLKE